MIPSRRGTRLLFLQHLGPKLGFRRIKSSDTDNVVWYTKSRRNVDTVRNHWDLWPTPPSSPDPNEHHPDRLEIPLFPTLRVGTSSGWCIANYRINIITLLTWVTPEVRPRSSISVPKDSIILSSPKNLNSDLVQSDSLRSLGLLTIVRPKVVGRGAFVGLVVTFMPPDTKSYFYSGGKRRDMDLFYSFSRVM